MAQLINAKGGMNIDGIIADFIATSEEIKAGSFVNYVNELSDVSSIHLLGQVNTARYLSACKLNDTDIFIAHANGNTEYPFAAIVRVQNDTITLITDIQITAWTNSAKYINCIQMAENKVLMTFSNGGNALHLYSTILEYKGGTTIEKTKSPILVSSLLKSSVNHALFKISETEAIVFHSNQDSETQNKISFTILNLDFETKEITIGNSVVGLIDKPNATLNMAMCMVRDKEIFVAYRTGTTEPQMWAAVIQIKEATDGNGWTCVVKDNKQILTFSTIATAIFMSATTVGDGRAFLAFSNTIDNKIFACVFNGTEHGNIHEISEEKGNANYLKARAIDKNNVIIFHGNKVNEQRLTQTPCIVEDVSFNVGRAKKVYDENYSAFCCEIVPMGDEIIILHTRSNSSYTLRGIVAKHKKEATIIKNQIDSIGVATQTKRQGQSVKIAIPKV